MLTREESWRATLAKLAVVVVAALLKAFLAIFSFGMHPARAASGCHRALGPGQLAPGMLAALRRHEPVQHAPSR